MSSYYCIVNLPGAPTREIAAVRAANDAEAQGQMSRVATAWPGFETIVLLDGERFVAVLANPALGFATEPFEPLEQAA